MPGGARRHLEETDAGLGDAAGIGDSGGSHHAPPVGLERIRIEIVSNFNAGAALTLRKKRAFSVCSVVGSRSRDYQSNPHFQCGIALFACALHLAGEELSGEHVEPLSGSDCRSSAFSV